MWHDFFLRETWLLYIRDMTRMCNVRHQRRVRRRNTCQRVCQQSWEFSSTLRLPMHLGVTLRICEYSQHAKTSHELIRDLSWDMTCVHVRHDSVVRVRLYICEYSQPAKTSDALILKIWLFHRETWLVCMWDMTQSYEWFYTSVSILRTPRLLTHIWLFIVRHVLCTCETWLSRMSDFVHLQEFFARQDLWHATIHRETRVVHMQDMTHFIAVRIFGHAKTSMCALNCVAVCHGVLRYVAVESRPRDMTRLQSVGSIKL